MYADCTPHSTYPCAHLPGDDVIPAETTEEAQQIAEDTNRAIERARAWELERFGDTDYTPEPSAHVCEWPWSADDWHEQCCSYDQWVATL